MLERQDSVASILTATDLAVLAMIDEEGAPIAAAVHVASDGRGGLLFKSRADSDHIRALARSDRASLVIYWHESTFEVKAGLQLRGRVLRITDEARMATAIHYYSARFPGARDKFAPIPTLIRRDATSTLYVFEPSHYKLVDNRIDAFDREYAEWPR